LAGDVIPVAALALVLALAGLPPVPVAVMVATLPWVSVLDVTDGRATCVRNGIIA